MPAHWGSPTRNSARIRMLDWSRFPAQEINQGGSGFPATLRPAVWIDRLCPLRGTARPRRLVEEPSAGMAARATGCERSAYRAPWRGTRTERPESAGSPSPGAALTWRHTEPPAGQVARNAVMNAGGSASPRGAKWQPCNDIDTGSANRRKLFGLPDPGWNPRGADRNQTRDSGLFRHHGRRPPTKPVTNAIRSAAMPSTEQWGATKKCAGSRVPRIVHDSRPSPEPRPGTAAVRQQSTVARFVASAP